MTTPDAPRNWSYDGHSLEAAQVAEPNRTSMRARVLRALRERALTTSDLVEIGGTEGTRRLRELRQTGYRIEAYRVPGSSQWAYVLISEPETSPDGLR